MATSCVAEATVIASSTAHRPSVGQAGIEQRRHGGEQRQGEQACRDPLPALAVAIDQRRPDDLERPGQAEQRGQADVGERDAAHLEVHRHDLLDDAERQPLGEIQNRDPDELAPQRHENADSSCSSADSQMDAVRETARATIDIRAIAPQTSRHWPGRMGARVCGTKTALWRRRCWSRCRSCRIPTLPSRSCCCASIARKARWAW